MLRSMPPTQSLPGGSFPYLFSAVRGDRSPVSPDVPPRYSRVLSSRPTPVTAPAVGPSPSFRPFVHRTRTRLRPPRTRVYFLGLRESPGRQEFEVPRLLVGLSTTLRLGPGPGRVSQTKSPTLDRGTCFFPAPLPYVKLS